MFVNIHTNSDINISIDASNQLLQGQIWGHIVIWL